MVSYPSVDINIGTVVAMVSANLRTLAGATRSGGNPHGGMQLTGFLGTRVRECQIFGFASSVVF